MTTEGLSPEAFEKWARDDAPSLDLTHCENRGDCQRLTFHYFEYATQKAWDAWQAALKQAPQEYEIMDTSSMKREPAAGKPAEPPIQPAQGSYEIGIAEEQARTREYLQKLAWSKADIRAWEKWGLTVAESPSQASTQPPNDIFPNDADCKLARKIHKRFCGGIDESCTDETEWVAQKLAEKRVAESISQATKEEWARRIADMEPKWFEDETVEVRFQNVLAILNEGK